MQIADHNCVLEQRLNHDARISRIAGACHEWNIRLRAPSASDPDRIIRIAVFEFDPYAGADRRDQVHTHRRTSRPGQRDTRLGPGRWYRTENVGDHQHQPAALLGVDVLNHRAAKLADEISVWLRRAHGPTAGVCEINPSLESVNDCLYSPCFMLWVTLFS